MKNNEFNGYCICVHCGKRSVHIKGKPCREVICKKCGKKMLRENSFHHQLYLQKKGGLKKNENSHTN